jgi:hypothetical protein
VNSQSNWYWSAENPRLIYKLPLHDEKVGVWHAISACRITGPVFYDDTVNAARYVNNTLSSYFAKLTEEERLYCFFQQDSITAHVAYTSLEAQREVFGDHIITHGLWPSCSPDFTSCDSYLWGSLKDKVFKTNPHSLGELRNSIRHEKLAICREELQRVNNDVFCMYTDCTQPGEQHFQHFLQHW